jgi:DNA-binding XRE family transcriptional regulator
MMLSIVLLSLVSCLVPRRYSWFVTSKRYSAIATKKLGKNLARLRQGTGLSQDSLAERLGIATRHMQALESGTHAPSLPLLLDLHKVLRAKWDDIFAGL